MPVIARIYFWLTIGFGTYATYDTFGDFNPEGISILALVLFGVAAFLAEIYEVKVLPNSSVSVSTAIYLGSLVIGGVQLALAVAIPSLLLSEVLIRAGSLLEGAPSAEVAKRVIFNTAQIVIAIKAGYLAFANIGGVAPPFVNPYMYLPPLVAFFVYTVVNTSLVSGIISLTQGISFFYQLKFNLRNLHVQVLSLGVLSILIAVTYASSPWNILLIAVLLLLVNNSLKGYIELRRQAKNTFEKIMDLLGKRDPYTQEHSESVGDLTEEIAEEMQIKPDRKEDIVSAARVHDIGKLGIPDSILLKEDGLTEEEWETMKEHPVVGADILSGLTIYDDAVDVVRYEHERWDGSGYPEGLDKEEIPLGSRVVAVADVWNALRTKRPYRGPLSVEESKEEIKEMAGVKLDPDVVDALLTVVEEGRAEVKN